MYNFFRWLFFDVEKDSVHNYHKHGCRLRNNKFTVIQNAYGSKLHSGYVKYCPSCGEKLDGKK